MSCETVQFGKWLLVFRRNVPPPPSTLKMEALCSSEMLARLYQTTRYHSLKVYNIKRIRYLMSVCFVLSVDSCITFIAKVLIWSLPSSGFKSKPSKKPAKIMQGHLLVSCLAYSSTLKIEAIRSSETSVDFYRTTTRYDYEYRSLRT
jgi:hypothetical protein